ncbi:MAG: DUF3426 domain-containing protein [Gammaproteobacteria bacterium]
MFTQCPNCKTIFQVTAVQLKAANGDVRCGQCLAVFNALDNLSEIEPANEHASTPDIESESNITHGDASTSIDKNLEEFFGDLFGDSPDESFDQPITYANPEIPDKSLPGPGGGFFYGANEATIEKILEDKLESVTDTRSESNTEVSIDTFTETNDESELLEPPIETDDKAEDDELSTDFDWSTGQADTDTSAEITAPEDADNKDSSHEDVNPEDVNPEDTADEAAQMTNVPSVILDELEAAKAQHLKPPSTQWVVGSIALMLVFIFQAVYFSRDSLAKNPTYRPALTSACGLLGCEINIEFDTRLIEIIGRDVRTHPSSKKALIAGTTLINNASYAQPYPLLTLTFSDITGTKLAQRRFTPREYLRNGTDIAAGMPSEVPVQVELHLVDPGKAAVNFEFIAEVDPRS